MSWIFTAPCQSGTIPELHRRVDMARVEFANLHDPILAGRGGAGRGEAERAGGAVPLRCLADLPVLSYSKTWMSRKIEPFT